MTEPPPIVPTDVLVEAADEMAAAIAGILEDDAPTTSLADQRSRWVERMDAAGAAVRKYQRAKIDAASFTDFAASGGFRQAEAPSPGSREIAEGIVAKNLPEFVPVSGFDRLQLAADITAALDTLAAEWKEAVDGAVRRMGIADDRAERAGAELREWTENNRAEVIREGYVARLAEKDREIEELRRENRVLNEAAALWQDEGQKQTKAKWRAEALLEKVREGLKEVRDFPYVGAQAKLKTDAIIDAILSEITKER